MVKVRMQRDLLDEKLTQGEWTPHDSRTYGGELNAYRLTCRELGAKPAAAKAPMIVNEYFANKRAGAVA
jgi:hypothetical protein